jgi:Mrp family chromosome partitioning ATPase
MSRIEEALARARNVTRENPAPPPIETAVKPAEPVFAAEADQPASSVDVPYPAIKQSAVETAQFEAVEEPAETEVDPTGDFRALPSAEKLMLTGGDSTPVEQYRRLAARLLMAQAEQGTRVVMITSALPGEG